MKTKIGDSLKINRTIVATITKTGSARWSEIADAVVASGAFDGVVKINYMQIRGELQALLNSGYIIRTSDLSKEIYTVAN